MTSIDELVRELHAQADETRQWPAPRVPRRRPSPARLHPAVVVLSAAVAVVIAVVAVPRLLDHHEQQVGAPAIVKLSPTEQKARQERAAARAEAQRMAEQARDRAVAQAWTSVRCAAGGTRCATPYVVEHEGRRYTSVAGGSGPTYAHGRVTSRFLNYGRDKPSRSAYVLVGATGSGPGSRLFVTIGDQDPVALAPGRLSLLPVPDDAGGLSVRVTERARPVPHETLVIEEYEPLR